MGDETIADEQQPELSQFSGRLSILTPSKRLGFYNLNQRTLHCLILDINQTLTSSNATRVAMHIKSN